MRLKRNHQICASLFALLMAGCSSSGASNKHSNGATSTKMEGIWRQASGRVHYYEGANAPTDNTTELTFPVEDDFLDRGKMEQYIEIQGTSLNTYAYFNGDKTYFKMTQTITCISDTCSLVSDPLITVIGSKGASLGASFKLVSGHLVETVLYSPMTETASSLIYTDITHDSYTDSFPPSGWPSTQVELN